MGLDMNNKNHRKSFIFISYHDFGIFKSFFNSRNGTPLFADGSTRRDNGLKCYHDFSRLVFQFKIREISHTTETIYVKSLYFSFSLNELEGRKKLRIA